MLCLAYQSRSPDRCPVAFSFVTAWLRLTPTRRTRLAARTSSRSASLSGASGPVSLPVTWASTTWAANAPRASPARPAASSSAANSVSVNEKCTRKDRPGCCRARRAP
jgi:hypothetical protein